MQFLKTRYLLDVKGRAEGRLVIRSASYITSRTLAETDYSNEQASSVFTTEVITKIFKEEGASIFDSRSASLGHILQGDIPSPLDRARAVRLSMKCMAFLEREALAMRSAPARQHNGSIAHPSKSSAAVITVQGSSVVMVPVHEMQEHADMKNRRNLKSWWEGYKELAEMLGGRTALIAHKKKG